MAKICGLLAINPQYPVHVYWFNILLFLTCPDLIKSLQAKNIYMYLLVHLLTNANFCYCFV